MAKAMTKAAMSGVSKANKRLFPTKLGGLFHR